MRELNDARKYHRETVPTLSESHAEKKPGLTIQAAQGISASSTLSQGSRQGSIQAVLPGSGITVGRQAPRVRSTLSTYKPAPQRSDSYEADDGFEL